MRSTGIDSSGRSGQSLPRDLRVFTHARELLLNGAMEHSPPRVFLIDARAEALAESALRARTRAAAAECHGLCTSRSYRYPLALLAVHHAAVGVDIERVEQCDEVFADSISTPDERSARAPAAERDRLFTSLWSSKEALSKALGNPLAYDPRRLEGPGAWPNGRSGPWRAGTLDVGEEHVGWLCWRLGASEELPRDL